MGDTALTTAIATVIATIITAAFGWATNKSSTNAAARNALMSSRTEVEKEAFERAKAFYTDTIERQDREVHGLEEDVDRLQRRVGELEDKVERQRVANEQREADYKIEIAALREELEKTRAELETAKAALRIKYPDER